MPNTPSQMPASATGQIPYLGRHRKPYIMDDRAAEARAAGLCSMCGGSRSDKYVGGVCRECNGVGTAQAETDTVLDRILAELEASDG